MPWQAKTRNVNWHSTPRNRGTQWQEVWARTTERPKGRRQDSHLPSTPHHHHPHPHPKAEIIGLVFGKEAALLVKRSSSQSMHYYVSSPRRGVGRVMRKIILFKAVRGRTFRFPNWSHMWPKEPIRHGLVIKDQLNHMFPKDYWQTWLHFTYASHFTEWYG